MASKMMSVREFAGHVVQILSSFPSNLEFDTGKIVELLYFTYGVQCSYGELVLELDKLVDAGRLLSLTPKQRYKIKPVTQKSRKNTGV